MASDNTGVLPLGDALGELEPEALLAHSIIEPEVLVRPSPYYRAMRERDPVRFDDKAGMWFISRYEDLMEIVRDPETYSVGRAWNQTFATGHFEEFKAILERDGGGYFPDAIMTDPPQHTRVRGLLQAAFTPSRIKQLEPKIRRVTTDLLDKIAPHGRADGVSQFAMPLTLAIMCEQLGIDHADGDDILRWSRAYGGVRSAQTREAMIAETGDFCELQNYVIALVEERQKARTDDMISDLIYARSEVDGEAVLSLNETVSLARALLIGGLDSIATAISTLLFLVATDPAIAAKFEESAGDESRLNRFIEEMLRFEPPARGLFRATTREVELSGTRVPEGALLCLLFASANDEEAVFAGARTFDMDRPHLSRHLSFGGGIHMCVGMHLARMQVKVAAQEVHRRLKDLRLAIPLEEVRYHPSLSLLPLADLPLTFTER